MSLNNYLDPQAYWESRLKTRFDLTGVGYSGVGTYYNAQMYQARLRALERALAYAQQQLTGAAVLDVGCGTGFYTEYCASRHCAAYMGIDLTEVSIQTLRLRYPDFLFVQADIATNSLRSLAKFDVVMAADVLYHIIDDQGFAQALENLCRAVKPGGILLIADVFPLETTQTNTHVRLRSQREYQLLLDQSGLAVKRIEPIFITLQPPIRVQDAAWTYRTYNFVWRVLLRLIARHTLEILCARTLSYLDESLLLPHFPAPTYTVKWLLATNAHVK